MGEVSLLTEMRERQFFNRIREVLEIPNLIELQLTSFKKFLQKDVKPSKRKNIGLQWLFSHTFPIESFNGRFSLDFVEYRIGEPRISEWDALEQDVNYQAPLYAKMRLEDRETGEIKEEEVFFGEIPLMTDRGTFIINGVERVVVSQLTRSYGIYFLEEKAASGSTIYTGKVIPQHGSWIEFELSNDVLYAKIDRRKKIPYTILLKVFGRKDNIEILESFSKGVEEVSVVADEVKGRVVAENVYNPSTGALVVERGRYLGADEVSILFDNNVSSIRVYNVDPVLANTLHLDPTKTQEEAYLELFSRLRPTDPLRIENARELIREMFLNDRRYSLGVVGRFKMNKKLKIDVSMDTHIITLEDLDAILKHLLKLKDGYEDVDDIDHLGNRRVRTVGELLEGHLRVGFLRMSKNVRDRMSTFPDLATATPQNLLNVRPVVASVREFFGSSQLSQFMDQTNPLAELTNKRRLSALGPGGLSRERAGFEARDVHYTHYGRICPIETPEGPNIGLVVSLTTYSKIDDLGFIRTPYRKVVNGVVTDEVVYLSADEEDEFFIAQANEEIKDGRLAKESVVARHRGELIMVPSEKIDYMDVSPKQVVSVSTSLIPFLEHDDANRALMGSNMQRQSVPLIKPEAPLVGTGMERKAAYDSGMLVVAKADGVVSYVSGNKIVIDREDGTKDEYNLLRFRRSNQGTCIDQKPIVKKGDKVFKGQVIADGPSMDGGELALGRNLLVAFMPWEGYNYEDAILINERLVKEDIFSSIHIEEYEVEARDTKLGPEEITRDIPNVGEDALKDLDENGIVRVGAEVKSGSILVGKITPKGESDLSAEERLLRAIFGDKAREVRDTSLRVPYGEGGKVVYVKVFSKESSDSLPPGVNKMVKVYVAQMRKVSVGDKLSGRHGNKGVISRIMPEEDMPFLPDGTPVDIVLNPLGVPSRMNLGQVLETHLGFIAKDKGMYVATPVFDGIEVDKVLEGLKELSEKYGWISPEGKSILYDGRTGEPFDHPVVVGYIYMMKLIHLVDDKIHARSIGPYSLITQQPLGGKAQFGGQRFGEMEVWALEGYGAASTLQEMLTIKSDDIDGRVKAYESVVKGNQISSVGVPESFKVLVKEMQGLALDVEVEEEPDEEETKEERRDSLTEVILKSEEER